MACRFVQLESDSRAIRGGTGQTCRGPGDGASAAKGHRALPCAPSWLCDARRPGAARRRNTDRPFLVWFTQFPILRPPRRCSVNVSEAKHSAFPISYFQIFSGISSFAIYVTGCQCHLEKRDNTHASEDESGNSDWKSSDNIYKKPSECIHTLGPKGLFSEICLK